MVAPTPASWSVTATVRADRTLCETFARHQLARGAARVFLFHDDPDMAPEIALPGVTNTICDAGWWRRGRPEALEQRQVHNATRAKGWCGSDWILHCRPSCWPNRWRRASSASSRPNRIF